MRLRGVFVVAAAGAALWGAACGNGGAPASALPADAILEIDGAVVTEHDIDEVLPSLLAWHPERGEESVRSEVLTAAAIPRAFARHDFPQGVARAKERAAVAMSMLRAKQPFEEVQKAMSEAPIPDTMVKASRRVMDAYLGAAVFGHPAGTVTEPVETTYGVVIARVELPIPEASPQQEGVILSAIEFLYDPSLANADQRVPMFQERMLRSKILVIDPRASRWIAPALQSRIAGGPGAKGSK